VSEALFRPLDEPPRAPSAVFVAYYDHAPNLDALDWYLSHIHPLIIQSIPEYRFFVVGRGSFSALRARFPSDPSVEWVGAVDDVAEAIARARIGVAPLVSGAGIRGKINQYLAAGRPVVTTGIGISGMDAHRHGQSLLVADDAERFAAAVVRLLREDDLWSRLRGAGRAVVDRHYRWGPALARLEALHGA
jgi:glycosyltransferase involved in cell wall biosynthesis